MAKLHPSNNDDDLDKASYCSFDSFKECQKEKYFKPANLMVQAIEEHSVVQAKNKEDNNSFKCMLEGVDVVQWRKVCSYRDYIVKLKALMALKLNMMQE